MYDLERIMACDSYKRKEIGFYPVLVDSLEKTNNKTLISIHFRLFKNKNEYFWQQMTGPVIFGFIKRHGEELLRSLNEEANVTAIIIRNSGSRIIFPVTYHTTFYILKNYSN